MSEKAEPEQIETVTGPTATRGERFKRHCARRWWMWLVGFVVFVVVVVIVVIFGIIPPVAQKTLDNTRLEVASIDILQPSPDNFLFSVTSYITGSSSIAHKATIDPMVVDFNLRDQDPFMSLPLPGVHGSDSILIESVNHTTAIEDGEVFGEFARTLMESGEFEMGVHGDTKIHLGGVKAKVKYREWVTLKGFNKLQGMVITSYTLASGDYGIVGKVVIPNPTVFTLQVGDVLLDMTLDNKPLGNGILPSLTITPGLKNIYDFKANLTFDNTIKLAKAVAAGTTVLGIRASDVRFGGASIPWLKGPLGAVDISVPIDTKYVL